MNDQYDCLGPLNQPATARFYHRTLAKVCSVLLLLVAAGCTQAGGIQLPPFPQPEIGSQSVQNSSSTSSSQPSSSPATQSSAEVAAAPLPGLPVFQFEEGEPNWYTVDDSVMGGISDSRVDVVFSQTGPEDNLIEDYRLYFAGTMSLENNGGFSSARSDWMPMDLSNYDGILLRVLGDGKNYRLRIRSAEFGSRISYNALFRTKADTWTLAYVPFEDMVPTRFGYVMDVGKLDPATVASFGLMLSDKQPGEFALQVDWMRAVTTADVEALQQSISRSQ